MAKSNFSGLADAIKEAQQQPEPRERADTPAPQPESAAAPSGRGRAPGKRSDPNWRQHTVMLEKENHFAAVDILRRQDQGQDVSDLLNSLLGQWVKRHQIKT